MKGYNPRSYNPRYDVDFIKRIEETYVNGKGDGTINKSVSFSAYADHLFYLFENSESTNPYVWLRDRNTALKLLKRYEQEKKPGESFPEWDNARLEKEYSEYIKNPPEFKGYLYDEYDRADHDERFPRNPTFDYWKDKVSVKFPKNFNHNPYFIDNLRVSTSSDPEPHLILHSPSPTLSFDEFSPQRSPQRFKVNPHEVNPHETISPFHLSPKKNANPLTSGRKTANRGGRKISKGKHKDKKSRKHTRKKLS
jgi:hypothetical protein